MPVIARSPWLPWLLFRLTLAIAILFVAVVVLAPWIEGMGRATGDWSRVVGLFAHDGTLRRTTLASAIGLAVTACVFFRPPSSMRRNSSRSPRVPPPSVAGA
jgi:hypothetical protein